MDAIRILVQALELYKLILIFRILLTWLPDIDWYRQPFKFLRSVTDPVLEPFRRLIPPVGGIDFSPMLLFFIIMILQSLLRSWA